MPSFGAPALRRPETARPARLEGRPAFIAPPLVSPPTNPNGNTCRLALMLEDKDLPEFWAAFWTPGTEEKVIVRRLFRYAAERIGSASALARSLGVTYTAIGPYLAG